MLCHTSKFARKTDDLYLLKVKTQSNPRLYFTDCIPGHLVFLHGLKKKSFDEDPADVKKAKQRLTWIKSSGAMSRFRSQ